MPKRAKRPTRKRTRRRPTKRASAIKKLKQSAKEAVKAGLTGGQIAGIVVGSTAVAGLGTAAAVLAAKDPEFYADYRDKDDDALDDGETYKPTLYEKMRGYPQRLQKERAGYSRGTMRSLSGPVIQTYPGGITDRFKQFREKKGMGNLYGKRRRRRRKKRKFGGSCDEHGGKKFGKKVSKKPSAALRRMCKRLKVRLTVKRGKKRVYKSEKVLKKQCKNAMKKK